MPQAATCPRAQVWTRFTADTMPAPDRAGPRQALDACSRVAQATGGTPSLVRNPTIHPCDLQNGGGGVDRRSRTPKRGVSEQRPVRGETATGETATGETTSDKVAQRLYLSKYPLQSLP